MDLDFNTHGIELRNAVDSVLNGNVRWVVLGYIAPSNSLCVISQGEKVYEFLDKFSSDRILFGFARVNDLTIGPLKFVLISWKGEGSMESLKTYYARHSDLVKRFCRTVHFTVHATNETDLDWNDIVRNTIGTTSVGYNESNNSFTEDNRNFEEDITPVGTNYEPIRPNIDCANLSNSRKFWQLKQNEQKTRPTPPILKAQKPFRKPSHYSSSNYGVPKIGASWNSNTTATKNSNNNNNNNNNNNTNNPKEIKEAEQISKTFIQNRVNAFQSPTPKQIVKKPEVVNKASVGYKKINPHAEIMLARKLSESACFDENLDNVGTKYKRTNAEAEIRAARASYSNGFTDQFSEQSKKYERTNAEAEIRAARAKLSMGSENSVFEQSRKYERTYATDEIHVAHEDKLNGSAFKHGQISFVNTQSNPFSTSKCALNSTSGVSYNNTSTPATNQFQNMDSQLTTLSTLKEESITSTNDDNIVNQYNDDNSSFITPISFNHNQTRSKLTAICLYDYTANENDELSFHAGDHIYDIEQIDDGWWVGSDSNGQIGLFPANYVELVA